MTGSFGGESGDAPVNVSTSTSGGSSTSTTTGNATNSTACRSTSNRLLPLALPRTYSNISLSSASDSDDILFVREQKPPHLRTPELVSLNSESDSDVMFVDEQKQDTTNQNCQQIDNNSNNSNCNSKKVPQPGIFEPSVSSEDSGCNSNNNLSNSMDIKDLPSTSSAFSPQQTTVMSLAYNNGASTSGEHSGIQSHKKFYARPRLNHSSSNKKSIYESSDSETSSSESSDSSSHDEVKFSIKSVGSRKRKRKCDNSDSEDNCKKAKKSTSKSKSRTLSRRKKTKKKDARKTSATKSSTVISKAMPQKEIKKEKKPKLKSVVIKKYQSSASSSSSSEYQESCDYDESMGEAASDSSWDF